MAGMIKVKATGDYKKTKLFFNRALHRDFYKKLEYYAQVGVASLAAATPVDSGETAESWGYRITFTPWSIKITWTNSNMAGNVPVVVLLQYGHGTRNGTFVEGVDIVNPALKSVFRRIADSVWKEVTE